MSKVWSGTDSNIRTVCPKVEDFLNFLQMLDNILSFQTTKLIFLFIIFVKEIQKRLGKIVSGSSRVTYQEMVQQGHAITKLKSSSLRVSKHNGATDIIVKSYYLKNHPIKRIHEIVFQEYQIKIFEKFVLAIKNSNTIS